jgi:integrase
MLLQKGLKPIAKELGLGNIGFHALRHACRSWLSSGGAALGTQKDLVRHADIGTTANIYGHALTEDMREAHAKLVAELLD